MSWLLPQPLLRQHVRLLMMTMMTTLWVVHLARQAAVMAASTKTVVFRARLADHRSMPMVLKVHSLSISHRRAIISRHIISIPSTTRTVPCMDLMYLFRLALLLEAWLCPQCNISHLAGAA